MGIELRRARSDDKPRILEISSQIWEGNDYVPFIVDDWLSDAGGEFVVALVDGLLVGFAHRTYLAPGYAWLEGIRTDPAHRGTGAAKEITRHFLEGVREERADRVGLSTHIENEASIHIIRSSGFEEVARFTNLGGEKTTSAWSAARPSDRVCEVPLARGRRVRPPFSVPPDRARLRPARLDLLPLRSGAGGRSSRGPSSPRRARRGAAARSPGRRLSAAGRAVSDPLPRGERGGRGDPRPPCAPSGRVVPHLDLMAPGGGERPGPASGPHAARPEAVGEDDARRLRLRAGSLKPLPTRRSLSPPAGPALVRLTRPRKPARSRGWTRAREPVACAA